MAAGRKYKICASSRGGGLALSRGRDLRVPRDFNTKLPDLRPRASTNLLTHPLFHARSLACHLSSSGCCGDPTAERDIIPFLERQKGFLICIVHIGPYYSSHTQIIGVRSLFLCRDMLGGHARCEGLNFMLVERHRTFTGYHTGR